MKQMQALYKVVTLNSAVHCWSQVADPSMSFSCIAYAVGNKVDEAVGLAEDLPLLIIVMRVKEVRKRRILRKYQFLLHTIAICPWSGSLVFIEEVVKGKITGAKRIS
ncbi:hypothetical protein BDW02DRAFT_572543 [Decorospora gaudefroyi]|uniref:Uncharacterized protein n=1 Tax=Decorospora gaudefroyi TaxID=184978 RepID=A0A6A5K904_9PLEO|nr:hypothetical protein BDW02DRAFT_572543 [Decorospora gaudefroyi]